MASESDLRMSRARLYSLIDGFEQDMRRVVERYLLTNNDEREILTIKELALVMDRREKDENGESVSLVHYLDIQTIFDLLLRHKAELPSDLSDEIVAQASTFSTLVPIRHRVMHGRPLNAEDQNLAVALLRDFGSRYWTNTRSTIVRLRSDSTWEPYFDKRAVPFEKTVHNLPEVDYDETSFIGRKEEKKRLFDALKQRRNSVVTVTGEGGIGKTALALDVAYQLLDSEDNPYEAILWVSLKTEKLTAFGVVELKEAISGAEDTIRAIGEGLVSDFSGSLTDLALALEDIQTLIIIDNLESAQGNEIVAMYDALPPCVNYLFTSRWGVGQLERIFPLPPLTEKESVLLLRKFAASRGQRKLAGLKEAHILNVVGELRNSPLAIRWFVLASEAGEVPLDVLRNQKLLLDFCVKNVVENLSEDSKAILTVLKALDKAIGFDEFAILTNMSIDALRRVTQELTRGSLVVVESETVGAIAGRLALTPTARSYLPRPDHNGSFIATVLRRERQYKASLQIETNERASQINIDIVRARDTTDHPAMYLLQEALKHSKAKQYPAAHANIERARGFNPEYAEVYRVSGIVYAAEQHNESAVAELQMALKYASPGEVLARITYSLADVISRRLHDPNLGLQYAEQAYNNLRCGDTAFLYGKLLVWTEHFERGHELIQEALDSARGRHRLVITTVLVDSWARWSDVTLKAWDYLTASQKAAAGFYIGIKTLANYPGDVKLLDAIAECSIYTLRSLSKMASETRMGSNTTLLGVLRFVDQHGASLSHRKAGYLADGLRSIRTSHVLTGPERIQIDKAMSVIGEE